MLHLLVFHAYINKMRGSVSKVSSKNLVRQCCAERFNSGIKGLTKATFSERKNCSTLIYFNCFSNICLKYCSLRE
jgi:hypothetical protein